jgi:hypothetical protein
MTAVLRTEMASNRERSEKKPFICCQWKNSLSSLELLMAVHVVQQIDICFKRKLMLVTWNRSRRGVRSPPLNLSRNNPGMCFIVGSGAHGGGYLGSLT